MTQIKATVGSIKDKDGQDFDPTARNEFDGTPFHIIPPGVYTAVIKGLKAEPFRAAVKDTKSPDKDGKWPHLKLIPDIEILNDKHTRISRQELIVGAFQNGKVFRPDGDNNRSAIWTTAGYFLAALGLLNRDETGEFSLNFNDELINSRVLKVRVVTEGYQKGTPNYRAATLTQMLKEVNMGLDYSFEDVLPLVDEFNNRNGYDEGAEERLHVKNAIVNYFPVDKNAVIANEWYLDEATGAVFLTELDYTTYVDKAAQSEVSDNETDADREAAL